MLYPGLFEDVLCYIQVCLRRDAILFKLHCLLYPGLFEDVLCYIQVCLRMSYVISRFV